MVYGMPPLSTFASQGMEQLSMGLAEGVGGIRDPRHIPQPAVRVNYLSYHLTGTLVAALRTAIGLGASHASDDQA